MRKLINWHKEIANRFSKKTGIDSCQLAWISWVKGVVMGVILMMISIHTGNTNSLFWF